MDQQEEWRPVAGFDGYEVSNLGRVMSYRAWRGDPGPRIMTGRPGKRGYPRVVLCRGSERAMRTVHSLVTEAFIGPRPTGQEVRHLDGRPTNNALTNLAYGTPSENQQDKLRHGTNRNASKTACKRGHPFDAANTYVREDKGRTCRTCYNDQRRERRAAARRSGGAEMAA